MKRPRLIIPPKKLLNQTNWGDPVFYHFYWYSRFVYRKRLKNTLKVIHEQKFNNLLEIGYGSGIFMPTLSKVSKKVTGLDLHKEKESVQRLLDWYQISNVTLMSGNIMNMPFSDHTFDGCVIVSTLEDIHDSEKAVGEIKRVVQKNGHIYISFPVKNLITDTFFKIVGEDPDDIHPSDHRYILNFLQKNFDVKRILKFPSFVPLDLSLYVTVHCVNT